MSNSSTHNVDHVLTERYWEAVDSLVRTLGSTLDVHEVAQRSLLTLTGHLLVRKAAFFLVDDAQKHMTLCECIGVREDRMGETTITLSSHALAELDRSDELVDLTPGWELSTELSGYFQFAARITDSNQLLGILLLGGKLGPGEFDEQSHRLLKTMGMVIGSTLRRSLLYEQMSEANRRLEDAQLLQQQIIDHVSHEFNTPLMILKSAVQFAKDTEGDEQAQFFDMHQQAVDRLESLVQAVLDMAHSEKERGGMISMDHQGVVEDVVFPLVEASSWRGEARCIQLHAAAAGYRISIDRTSMTRALGALIHNAWQFAREEPPRMLLQSYIIERTLWHVQDHRSRIRRFA